MKYDRIDPARILIVDNHPIVCLGYTQLIGSFPEWIICGSAESGQQARKLVKSANPALALVDIKLKDGDGIALAKELQQSHPQVKILVVSASDEPRYAERALDAGALGYFCTEESAEQLIEAIQTVLAGEIYVSEQLTRQLLRVWRRAGKESQRVAEVGILTDRELQVFELIAHGELTRQIAVKLLLSTKTVERHKANIQEKLRIANATELAHKATQWLLDQ